MNSTGTLKAVFIDRDGTINNEKNYLCRPEDFHLIPGADLAMRRLQDAGYLLIVVTNQSGIGRGYYTEADMHAVNQRMCEIIRAAGVQLTHIYYAPEAPEQPSRGRKPSPAFLHDARDQYGIDLSRSFMIGDKWIDLQTGWNAGCASSLLVRTGYGAETEIQEAQRLGPAVVVDDLPAAAEWILTKSV